MAKATINKELKFLLSSPAHRTLLERIGFQEYGFLEEDLYLDMDDIEVMLTGKQHKELMKKGEKAFYLKPLLDLGLIQNCGGVYELTDKGDIYINEAVELEENG